MTRREVAAGGIVALAGCSLPGGSGGGSGGGRREPRDTVVCRTVTRERERIIYDELDTWGAGESYTWSVDLNAGERVRVRVVTVEGARADLEIKNRDGEVVVDTGPTTPLEQTITAAEGGTHYIVLTNEAMLTSGQWDAQITVVERISDTECE